VHNIDYITNDTMIEADFHKCKSKEQHMDKLILLPTSVYWWSAA